MFTTHASAAALICTPLKGLSQFSQRTSYKNTFALPRNLQLLPCCTSASLIRHCPLPPTNIPPTKHLLLFYQPSSSQKTFALSRRTPLLRNSTAHLAITNLHTQLSKRRFFSTCNHQHNPHHIITRSHVPYPILRFSPAQSYRPSALLLRRCQLLLLQVYKYYLCPLWQFRIEL